MEGERFIPERIQVIQMYETEEQKRIREEKEQQLEEERNNKLSMNIKMKFNN